MIRSFARLCLLGVALGHGCDAAALRTEAEPVPAPVQNTSVPTASVHDDVPPPLPGTHRVHLESGGATARIDLPTCPDGSVPTKQDPPVLIPENAHSRMFACVPETIDVLDPKPMFSVMIAPAAEMMSIDDIRESIEFRRFTREDPDRLEWEIDVFDKTIATFRMRKKIGDHELACMPWFDTPSAEVLTQMRAACDSLREAPRSAP